jgi:hypothetical protein
VVAVMISIGARLNARLGLKKEQPKEQPKPPPESFPGSYARVDERVVPSHRATTSSRTPGRVNEGTVQVRISGLRTCGDCGVVTSAFVPAGQHGIRWRGNELVNCVGRVLV